MRTQLIVSEPISRTFLGAVLAAMRDGLARVCDQPSENQAIAHMESLPDYLLRDLGIRRSDIGRIVRGPTGQAPRACHRAS